MGISIGEFRRTVPGSSGAGYLSRSSEEATTRCFSSAAMSAAAAPEPLTVMGVLAGLGGLLGYVRRQAA